MNITNNQKAIDDFIDNVEIISELINSKNWNGEDVMGIFFNEFNRYKRKSENGQVFTPDHVTSLMYRLVNINPKEDVGIDNYRRTTRLGFYNVRLFYILSEKE